MESISQKLISKFQAPDFKDSYMISFEGIEGAGKSTHINRLKEDLEKEGFTVYITREPGGTAFGEKLREAILQSEVPLDPIAEAHLFASSRAQLLKEFTLEKLKTPKTIVIYDRYLDSSLAYQGIARGLGISTILEVHSHYPLTTVPNLTLYIEISLETSKYRQGVRGNEKDYFESEKDAFYNKLIDGYMFASGIFKDRFAVIDGEHDKEEVYRQIKEAAFKRLLGK